MGIFTGTAEVILLMSRVEIHSSSPLILLVGIMIALIVNLVLTPQFDRQRIRENVGANGGTVMSIIRVWGWGNRNDRAYEVSYIANGKRVKATCRTSMWRGVYWVDERPPGFDSEMAVASSLADEKPQIPAAPIRCFDCGSIIPKDQTRCPQCGWGYNSS